MILIEAEVYPGGYYNSQYYSLNSICIEKLRRYNSFLMLKINRFMAYHANSKIIKYILYFYSFNIHKSNKNESFVLNTSLS